MNLHLLDQKQTKTVAIESSIKKAPCRQTMRQPAEGFLLLVVVFLSAPVWCQCTFTHSLRLRWFFLGEARSVVLAKFIVKLNLACFVRF